MNKFENLNQISCNCVSATTDIKSVRRTGFCFQEGGNNVDLKSRGHSYGVAAATEGDSWCMSGCHLLWGAQFYQVGRTALFPVGRDGDLFIFLPLD